jgi:hypothetical protein
VAAGGANPIIVDPAFPLKVSTRLDDGSVHAEGALNGGGEILRLRTVSGNIQLVLSDAQREMDQYKKQLQEMQKQLQEQIQQSMAEQNGP